MPTKKVTTEPKEETKKSEKTEKYFYAVGRRKTSVAKIKLFVAKTSKETQNSIVVNGKKLEDYFPIERLHEVAKSPLETVGGAGKFTVEVKVSGGGVSAQADAVRLGISRALIIHDAELKKVLKSKGFLTRDPREVERKKPGLKKARKSPQWAKR